MERVTVQFNGEMVTLDVPEGMTDDEIIAFLQQSQQQQQPNIAQTTGEPSLATAGAQVAGQGAAKATMFNPQYTTTSPVGPVRPTVVNPTAGNAILQEAVDLTKIAGQVSPAGVRSFVEQPTKILQIPGAFMERYIGTNNMGKTIGDMVKGAGRAITNPSNYVNAAKAVGGAIMAPENILAAPYTMAGYEQEKIRANPTAPEYEFNPYAMAQRGQTQTQGQAGARNIAQARQQMPTGPITPDQAKAILESGSARDIAAFGGQDKLNEMIRRKAAERVLGPVIP